MKSEVLEGLPSRIRKCAEIAGSGDELSRKSGLPRRTLENYLSGRSEPKATAILAIANAAEVSSDWLLTGEVDKPTKDDLATPVVGSDDHHAGYPDEPPFNSAVLERVIVAYMEWLTKYTTNDRSGPEHDAGAITAIYRVVIKDFIEEGTIQLDAVKSRVNVILNYLSENS